MVVHTGGSLYAEASENVEPAPAKVNLALHVTGRRSDGMHLLDSLVVFAGEGDIIRAMPAPAGTITTATEGPFGEALSEALKGGGEDIVLKAVQALKRPPREGAKIIINKRLPLAAGLGGGSADAAAALRLLCRLWTGGSERGLEGIAARLGADVPMCLRSVPLRAQGIGDRLTPLTGMPALSLVLVNPGVALSTAQVFKNLERADDPPLPEIPRAFKSVFELVIWLRETWNGLDKAARAETRIIGRVVAALAADPDCLLARMTGSGPTCFGIFASPGAAHRAAVRLRIGQPEWWIAPCVTGAS